MIITNSGEPVVVSIGPHGENKQICFTKRVIDIDKSKLVDSNSAGDSFVGGFFAKIILMLEQRKVDGVADDLSFTVEEL